MTHVCLIMFIRLLYDHDPCIDGKQCTLMVHVDDIKKLSNINGEAKRLYNVLVQKFGKVTYHDGLRRNYLGMTFNYCSDGKVIITMEDFKKE